jgi:serine/threonine-protein kinase HipA
MNGELVGTWRVERGNHAFIYENAWKASPHCRSLSLSLPMGSGLETRGDAVRNYFDNLLPDNAKIRERLGRRFMTRSAEIFDLLEAIGRDCVGAVQLLPPAEVPQGWDRIDAEPLSEDGIVEILQAVPSETTPQSLQHGDSLRISLAGAQEKTALTRWRQAWCRPQGATPTTHIFKLPLGLIGGSRRVDASDSVQNEWLCARLLSALGFPVAPAAMETFGGQTVLVVERFDREWQDENHWIARLPQEDFCQALGVAPDRKYEADGGPGMSGCLQLLRGSVDAHDGTYFLLVQLAFSFMAATDGHAKNFSIHLQRGDRYHMTPLYDVLSMWPYFGDAPSQFRRHKAGLAMTVRSKNPHKYFHTVEARHWQYLAMKNGGPPVWEAMQALAENVDGALAQVEGELPASFPQRTWAAISSGMRAEARRFMAEAAALPAA